MHSPRFRQPNFRVKARARAPSVDAEIASPELLLQEFWKTPQQGDALDEAS
jgi:hypothetical protein